MKRQNQSFFGLTVSIILLGIMPAAFFFSTGEYFRSMARQTDTWRCSCGAIEMITHPRADTLASGLFILGGAWMLWIIFRTVLTLTRQVQQISPMRSRVQARKYHRGIALEIVDWPTAFAMTVGSVRPTIIISRATEVDLAPAELSAVLDHEAHHAQRRDPLLTVVVSVVGQIYGFLPAARHLIERWTMLREITADQAATKDYTDRRGLAGALLKMSTSGVDAVPAFSPNLIRIDTLLRPETALPAVAWKFWVVGVVLFVVMTVVGLHAGTAWAAEPTQQVIRQCHEIHQMCQRLEVQSLLLYTPRGYSIYGL
jgi:beta-lactamase regulating signal transducer with metallopeptidase domain